MATPRQQRVRKHREALREAGRRPVQLWLPDTRAPACADECRRQCLLAARADEADAGVLYLLDEAPDDLPGWQA